MTPMRIRAVAIALSMAFGSAGAAGSADRSTNSQDPSGANPASRRMVDGKEWTTENVSVATAGSYCFDDAEANCRRYGRLYTWEAAQRACQTLGTGWRLPAEDEWRRLAKHYGGIREDSADAGKAVYTALLIGGTSGFNALLSGNRNANDGQYARLEAHGFYWTATETAAGSAWFYNFGRGGQAVNRHREGSKQMAVSVRCVRD